MKAQELTKADLAQFTGSEQWYRHPLARNIFYTDGIQYVAQRAGAYWLIDEIACQQKHPCVRKEDFQVWTLRVNLEQSTATLFCDDGNGHIVCQKNIDYTDFPLAEIKIYVANNVILLPGEY